MLTLPDLYVRIHIFTLFVASEGGEGGGGSVVTTKRDMDLAGPYTYDSLASCLPARATASAHSLSAGGVGYVFFCIYVYLNLIVINSIR